MRADSYTLSFKTNIFNNKWLLFVGYTLIYFVTSYFFNQFVYTDDLYFQSLGNRLAAERIEQLLVQRKKLLWIGYAIIPVIVYLKLLLPAVCLYTGIFFDNLNIKWKKTFEIVFGAEVALLLPVALRFVYFLIFPPSSVEAASTFAPLSLAQIVKPEQHYWLYALQTLNVFEAGYWLLLAKGIQDQTNLSFWTSLSLVARSYGLGLLMWIVFITFLAIQFS